MRRLAVANLMLLGTVLAGGGIAAEKSVATKSVVPAPGSAPRAVTVARTTTIPNCTSFVDAASSGGDGSAQKPHKTIAAAVGAERPGAIICVAEGSYTEEINTGENLLRSPAVSRAARTSSSVTLRPM
jgi:hypothetical protein